MDIFSVPPDGSDPEDLQRTQQFWPGGAVPPAPGHPGGGPGGPGPGAGQSWQGAPGPGPHPPRNRHRTRWRWTAGIVAAVLVAGGAAIAGVMAAGSSPGQDQGAQAAALNAVLSSADTNAGLGSAQTATPQGPGAVTARRRCARAASMPGAHAQPRAAQAVGGAGTAQPSARTGARRARVFACRHPRLVRAILRGVHGEFTFQGRQGLRTLAFERGTVTSVTAGHDIVVRATDGTTWTWDLASSTVVRERGGVVAAGTLSAGDAVWVGGPVRSGAKDARLILIRPPAGGATPSTSPAPGT